MVLVSNFLGHVLAPSSILLTPLLVGFITWVIVNKCNYSLVIKFLIIIFLILLNDIIIRLFAGGAHDSEGNAWIFLFFIIGILVSFITFLIYGIIKKHIWITIICILVSIPIYYYYLDNFGTLGNAWIKPNSENVNNSIKDKIFVSKVRFNDSIIVAYKDTFYLIDGWIEKEVKFDNNGFIKKNIETGKFNQIINIKGHFDQYGYCDSVFYRFNDTAEHRGYALTRKIEFVMKSKDDTLNIYFYKGQFKMLIKKIITVANNGYKI